MIQIVLRFYAELNFFLPEKYRQVSFEHDLHEHDSIKQVIESIGIPHTEVDLITRNGSAIRFEYQVQNGDRFDIYPVFETFDISDLTLLRPSPLRETKFVLDTHLGKLSTYLRMCGFDSLYRNDFNDETLANISANENRILLTRDRGLLKRSIVTHGYLVKENLPKDQLLEVLKHFYLTGHLDPLTRCLKCNTQIKSIDKAEIENFINERTAIYYQDFWICPSCQQIYWQGSHYNKMLAFINSAIDRINA